MTRTLAGLVALLLLAGVAAGNTPTDHPYHTLYLTELLYAPDLALNPQDDYCYGVSGTDRLLKSNGGAWSLVCDMSDEGYAITTVLRPFFTAAGDLLITGLGAGADSLWKAESTDYTTWTSVLEWPCSDHEDNCKPFAHGICEGGADTLFVGQYCGDTTDTCATIWRSDDAGDTWTQKYHLASRHIHGVWYDSLIDSVYASVGDTPESCLIIGSPDRGENWTVLRRWTSLSNGPLSFSARPGIRFFGSDAYGEYNRIFSTTDDAAFADTLLFSERRDGYVWAMSQDAEGVIYAGTVKKGISGTDTIAIYYRMPWDDDKWYKYDLGTQATEWRGVLDLTEFDASGYAYFRYYDEGDDSAVFKFRRSPTYTVGSSGDYATIAAALAGDAAAGDTLILLAGQTHTFSNIDPPATFTIRGATSDRDLYTMMQASANADGINVDDSLILKNLTMREKVDHAAYDVSLIQIDDDDVVLTLDNVRIAGVDGGARNYPGLLCLNREPTLVTFTGCHFDSMVTTGNYAVATYATDAGGSQLVIEDSIVSNCSSARSPVAVIQSATADTVRFTGCLFADNAATSDYGGAVRFQIAAGSDPAVIGYCTFDSNASGDVDDGQISFNASNSAVTIHHTIITNGGTTWALHNLGAADITAINHCDTWGNGRDAVALVAAAFTDTLHQDPDYNRTGTYATGWYQAMDCNVCNIAGGGTYMGWEQWLKGCQRDTVGADEKGGHKRTPHSKR